MQKKHKATKASEKKAEVGREERKEVKMEEIMDLLSPLKKISVKISGNLEELEKEPFVVVMKVSPEIYNVANIGVIKYFTDKRIGGVYVTTNKSVFDLVEFLDKSKVNYENVSFLDAISKMTERAKKQGNFNYIESPYDLTSIDIEANKLVDKIKSEKKFFILDSVNTLLIYNEGESVKKFCHTVIEKMKGKGLQTIIIVVESKQTEELFDMLAQFCDKIVDIK